MASFAPIRGTRTQIGTTPIVDGQFLVETNQGANNRIYLDTGSTRSVVGGGTGLLPHLNIILDCNNSDVSSINSYTVTVTNPDGTSTTPVTYTTVSSTERLAECNVNSFGTYIIQINFNVSLIPSGSGSLTKTKAVEINSASECNIKYMYGRNINSFVIDGTEDNWSEIVTQSNGMMMFTGLDPDLGYKLYVLSSNEDIGDLSIPKWTSINKTISSGQMTLTYTISGGTNGSTKGVLRILK